MRWLRGLKNWLKAPAGPDPQRLGEADTPVMEGVSRPANWNDVFHVARLLERHRVEYVLIGGYALSYNGLTRQTGDVDILVRNTTENNRRWVDALCELPNGKAKALLVVRDDPFGADPVQDVPIEPYADDEPGAIRIADEFVIDVLPAACGLTFEDLEPHIRHMRRDGYTLNVLDLPGLRLTKQGTRAKDQSDLMHIEAALRALTGELDWHAKNMNRRRFTLEPLPRADRIEFRMPDEQADRTLELAAGVLARARDAGGEPDTDPDTLVLYANEDVLAAMLAHPDAIRDIRGYLAELGVNLPSPGI